MEPASTSDYDAPSDHHTARMDEAEARSDDRTRVYLRPCYLQGATAQQQRRDKQTSASESMRKAERGYGSDSRIQHQLANDLEPERSGHESLSVDGRSKIRAEQDPQSWFRVTSARSLHSASIARVGAGAVKC